MKFASRAVDNNAHANVIFNPDFVQLPPQFVGRADWPATTAFQATGETVDYRESIIDNDNGAFGSRDDYRRRFYSTRVGRQIR